jgi:hypothetical protein
MGKILKKGKLFLGKGRLPRSARRARKPLQNDWITGKPWITKGSKDEDEKNKKKKRKNY